MEREIQFTKMKVRVMLTYGRGYEAPHHFKLGRGNAFYRSLLPGQVLKSVPWNQSYKSIKRVENSNLQYIYKNFLTQIVNGRGWWSRQELSNGEPRTSFHVNPCKCIFTMKGRKD